MISRSSLESKELLASLRQRHELGEWVFPALTESELQGKGHLQRVIERIEELLRQDAESNHNETTLHDEGEGILNNIKLPTTRTKLEEQPSRVNDSWNNIPALPISVGEQKVNRTEEKHGSSLVPLLVEMALTSSPDIITDAGIANDPVVAATRLLSNGQVPVV